MIGSNIVAIAVSTTGIVLGKTSTSIIIYLCALNTCDMDFTLNYIIVIIGAIITTLTIIILVITHK